MARTIAQILDKDLNELAIINPSIAANFMGILDHAMERAKEKGTKFVCCESLECSTEGHVKGELIYGKKSV